VALIDTLRSSGALVLYLDLRSGNTYDYSGNAATVTLTSPIWNSRNGLSFAGSTSKIVVTDKASLRLTTGSIVALSMFKIVSGSPQIVDKSSAGGINYRFYFDTANIYLQDNTVSRSIAYSSIAGKKSLAVNFGDGTAPEFFVNGVSIGSAVGNNTVSTTVDNVTIGNAYDSSNHLRNNLSAVVIINRKLTAAEHAQIFGELQAMKWPTKTISRIKPVKNIGLPEANLLSAFELQQNGATVYDNGSVMNNATNIGPPWFSKDRMGKTAEFYTPINNGSIQNADNAAYTFEFPVSMSAWYRPKTVGSPTQAQIVGRGYRSVEGSTSPLNQGLYVASDQKAYFKMNSSNLNLGCAAADIFRVGVWTHVAATYDGVNATLYINGQQSAQTPYSTAWVETNRRIVIGGEISAAGECPGHIADCKYYQRALSAAEILQEYKRGAPAGFTVGAAKQQSLAATGNILSNFWTNRTSTGVTGVEVSGAKIITYAQASAASILRLVSYTTSNRLSSTYGTSWPGQITRGQACFGTWQWYINKTSDTSTVRLVPMLNSSSEWDSGGGVNGYLLEIDANEAIGVYRVTTAAKASTIMVSANGYITRNVWHKIKLTRAVKGTFTLYVDDVLVPASAGANPGSDTTYLTGVDITQVSLTDGDKFALSCNTGACNFLHSYGVI